MATRPNAPIPSRRAASTTSFHMMVRFKTLEDTIRPARGNRPAAVWTPLPESAETYLEMDDTSVDAISSAMLRKLVVPLAKLGLIPAKYALETVGVPHAEELAEAAEKQMALAALSKLKRPR